MKQLQGLVSLFMIQILVAENVLGQFVTKEDAAMSDIAAERLKSLEAAKKLDAAKRLRDGDLSNWDRDANLMLNTWTALLDNIISNTSDNELQPKALYAHKQLTKTHKRIMECGAVTREMFLQIQKNEANLAVNDFCKVLTLAGLPAQQVNLLGMRYDAAALFPLLIGWYSIYHCGLKEATALIIKAHILVLGLLCTAADIETAHMDDVSILKRVKTFRTNCTEQQEQLLVQLHELMKKPPNIGQKTATSVAQK